MEQVMSRLPGSSGSFLGRPPKRLLRNSTAASRISRARSLIWRRHAPTLERNGGIIRKCRIAMDLDWGARFTGEKYDAYDLPKLEREHIIPYATSNTNALHALVLTWPEVNKMKGKRTARQFIADHEGNRWKGKPISRYSPAPL